MPSAEDRVQAIKNRVAKHQARLATIKVVQRLNNAIKDDEQKMALLKSEIVKKQADKKRREDKRIVGVLGSSISLLAPEVMAVILRVLIGRVQPREREGVQGWCAERGLKLSAPDPGSSPTPVAYLLARDLEDRTALALHRVVAGLDRSVRELIFDQVLGPATGQDRDLLEGWVAELNGVDPTLHEAKAGGQHGADERSLPEDAGNGDKQSDFGL